MSEINKVQLNIRKFLFETENAVKDEKSAFDWLVSFRRTLQYQELVDKPNRFAISLLCEAFSFNMEQKKRSLLASARRMLIAEGVEKPTKEQVSKKFEDVFAKEFADEFRFSRCENEIDVISAEIVEEPAKDPSKLIWGRFENVYLSQDEYNELANMIGNINDTNAIINSLSAELEEGRTSSKNHFATLSRWVDARKRNDEEKGKGMETFAERENRRQVEQLKKYGMIK